MQLIRKLIRKESLPVVILIFFGVVILFMGLMNHYLFRTFVFDYGNYNYAFWDYSHFRISPMPTYPGNFLQDHFSFLLMYFIPLYWFLNWLTGTYTLIIIQNLLILVAAWYSYKLIRLKSGNFWLGIGVLIYYFLLLGRWSTFAGDVNLAVMSACFIPVFLYFFELKKYGITFIILILSLLARENIPLWFIFIFIVLIIQHRKDKKAVVFSLAGAAISLLYFILLFKVFIPSIETEEKTYTLFNYSALGETPSEAFLFILKNPVEFVRMLFVNHLANPAYNGIKAEFYLVYLLSGGFILLYRPQYLIWFIPIVAQKVLNDFPIRWGILTYYSIEVVTLLPLSVFLVINELKSRRLQNILAVFLCLAAFSVTLYKLDKNNRVVASSYRPAKENIFSEEFYSSKYDLKKTYSLLKEIPEGAKVSSSGDFFSHLSQRRHIYFFPDVKDAEYIVFSVYDDYWRISHMENENERNRIFNDPEWEVIGDAFPVFLFKRKDEFPPGYSGKSFLSHLQDTLKLKSSFEVGDTMDNYVFFDDGTIADQVQKLSSLRARSGKYSLLLSDKKRFGYNINLSGVKPYSYLKASVWFYGENENAFLVSSYGNTFYFSSNTVIEEEDSGWKKISLSLWIPPIGENKDFGFYLYNSSKDKPVFFDDIELIRITK